MLPFVLVETIEVIPSIVENSFSSGSATVDAIVSGLAPGSVAVTSIVGKSTDGRSFTGSLKYAKSPKIIIESEIRIVVTGRFIKNELI